MRTPSLIALVGLLSLASGARAAPSEELFTTTAPSNRSSPATRPAEPTTRPADRPPTVDDGIRETITLLRGEGEEKEKKKAGAADERSDIAAAEASLQALLEEGRARVEERAVAWPERARRKGLRWVGLVAGERAGDADREPTRGFLEFLGKTSGLDTAASAETMTPAELEAAEVPPALVHVSGRAELPLDGATARRIRAYIDAGGLLLGDASDPHRRRTLEVLAGAMYPERSLEPVPASDEVFRVPHPLESGAAPRNGRAGARVLGVRGDGRWLILLFPGSLNEAWAGNHPEMDRDRARRFGVNVLLHAYRNAPAP